MKKIYIRTRYANDNIGCFCRNESKFDWYYWRIRYVPSLYLSLLPFLTHYLDSATSQWSVVVSGVANVSSALTKGKYYFATSQGDLVSGDSVSLSLFLVSSFLLSRHFSLFLYSCLFFFLFIYFLRISRHQILFSFHDQVSIS